MRTLLTAFFCVTAYFSISAQGNESTKAIASLKSELAQSVCLCIDSIDVHDRTKAEVAEKISNCIHESVGAFQIGSKLLDMDSLLKKGGVDNKKVDISINTNKNSDEYKRYYYELESYLMDSCEAIKERVAANDKLSHKSMSTNEEAVDYYTQGVQAYQKQDYKEAIRLYKKALSIDDQFAFAWDNLGLCYRKSGEYDLAIEAYERSLQVDPNGEMPLQNLAIVYQYKKDFKQAIATFERLKKRDPKNAEVYFGIGNIQTQLEEFESALDHLCKAYNLYIEQKSPYRSDAEQLINYIYKQLKAKNKEARFKEILQENNIRME